LASFAISGGCYFQALNGIKLGKNFLFAPGVKLISANHDFSNHNHSIKENPIIIGDNVWLGANVIILPGVELGNNCIVGAGSVVTKSFKKDNLVIAGNPARIIKEE
jgi:acetyltransferase-like isoleucine patch superfamily enzyme